MRTEKAIETKASKNAEVMLLGLIVTLIVLNMAAVSGMLGF